MDGEEAQIDRNNGGSLTGMLGGVIAVAKPTREIAPGHGPVVDTR